jgi:3-hydroxyacyl-CoA dehydrogenase / enoyl-CoA hydratase / 3-hydroxybutyryl-CoA epimerase
MSIQESVRIADRGEVALIEWDMFGEKANKLSSATMNRFGELLKSLSGSKYKAAVIISRKPSIFMAGADIEEIKGLKKREDFEAAVRGGQDVLNQIEDLGMPVIAAIHGACVGGGCELIMACDYRIATDDSATKIGLPEVKLGIIPGFGGCVRMPRMIGIQAALDIILNGKTVEALKASKIGLVDQIVNVSILEEKAIAQAKKMIADGGAKRVKKFEPRGPVAKLMESSLVRWKIYSEAEKLTMKATNGHYPAPLKALDVIKKTYGLASRDRALEIEREGFCDVGATDVSKNLIDVFFLMESVKKKNGVSDVNVKAKDVKKMGVLGAGTMGGGIAYVAADRGIEVRLKDINNAALAIGFSHARSLWDKLLKRKKINNFEFAKKMNLVSGGLDFAGFKTCDVVVEAIVEDMKIKQKVIGETAANCRPDCVIATNTSSLSVTTMAAGHPHPENFVGMHFFNPVDKMPLVEIIRGAKSSDMAIATVFDLSKRMGKLPVVVKDGPGFLVNRILMPYLMEAAYILEDGMSVELVDKYFKKNFGMPMGPFTLMDEIGIDVCLKVSKIFHESLGERVKVPAMMKKLGETDRLGKKSKKGFYLYDEKGKQTGFDATVYTDLGLSTPTDKLSEAEVVNRGIFAMVNEAALALIEEHVVETPAEVDLAMITGTGFPPFRGGLLKYADSLGSRKIADQLELFATQYGERFKPCTPLRNMAKTDRKFY